MGIYDCQTQLSIRRQFSAIEGAELNIAMKEILAIKFLIQNLDISSSPQVIR